MSSDTPERVVVTTEEPSKSSGFIDSLASRFRQSVETRSSSPSIGILSGRVPTVEAADGVDEFYEIYKTTGIVFTSLNNFASDVWTPGYRVEIDEDDPAEVEGQTAAEWLEDEWLPQAAILHGGKHNDFLSFGKHTTIQRWARGGALIEHVRADRNDADSLITGVNFIPPETVSFVPYKHKPVLIDPDPEDGGLEDELPKRLDQTRRGEYPAYIQYHKNAPSPTNRDPIPLSQNDVTRTIFNGDAAGVGTDLDNFWGTPATEIISEDVAGFKNILRDKETAIKNKAYGLWKMGFGRETFEYTDVDGETGEEIEVTEVIEWAEEEMDELAGEVENEMGPGSILTHDGEINLDRIDGEVPDLTDDLVFYVSNIVSALPSPLFVVGFEKNINQFVTEKQDNRYQQLVDEERQQMERLFTDICQRVIDSHPEHDAEVTLKIEPPESESPVLSLNEETIARMEAWASAFNDLRGDMPVDMLVNPKSLRELILQLPEDAEPDISDVSVDESDPAVQEQADELESILDEMASGSGGDGDSDQELSPPAEADD